jgi:hypothetical protein
MRSSDFSGFHGLGAANPNRLSLEIPVTKPFRKGPTMDEHNIDSLLGKFIAQNSLLASLIRVLPLEGLRALESELHRDVEFGKDFFVAQNCSDQTISSFEWQADANIELVRKALADKEALQSPDAALHWMKERLDPKNER